MKKNFYYLLNKAQRVIAPVLIFLLAQKTDGQITNITGPAGSGQFGNSVTVLANGNFVVTDPYYDNGPITEAGAVYLYNGSTYALISTLKGSTAGDRVGSDGIFPLSNGNFVVLSPIWDNGAIVDAGAATWLNGTTGLNGVVSSANSLVGSKANDLVGSGSVTALSNGNYIVSSFFCDNGAVVDAGAVTWGNGATGISGVVSTANSILGSTADDNVSNGGITSLTNGNYVIISYTWDNGAVADAGAVSWRNGTIGTSGTLSSANSLVGTTASDQVGINGVVALSNGNYVVLSNTWDRGSIVDAGAVTWGNGTTGIFGTVSISNSLVGITGIDQVGYGGVTALTNGNYVVESPYWDNGSVVDAGAATWGNGTTGISGAVSATNSLVGVTDGDNVSSGGVIALTNGNYAVSSPNCDNGIAIDAGAVTWGNGNTGLVISVNSSNSLVGTTDFDQVGYDGIIPLINGNFVIRSHFWDNGTTLDAGAVTWGNGAGGLNDVVSSANSLVGSTDYDYVGLNPVTALSNGNYVVRSPDWDNGTIADAGAVTWGNGSIGINGLIDNTNSLVGSIANDFVGIEEVTALTNGNYVVRSPNWDNGSINDVGAVTWGDGTTGITGVINTANSLEGSTVNDRVGNFDVIALANGNYVVSSTECHNGVVANAGAVTLGNGTTGINGFVSSSNSLVGNAGDDFVGYDDVKTLNNGNYVVFSRNWDNGSTVDAGAVTWGNGSIGVKGTINSCNSVTGNITGTGDSITIAVHNLYNYVIVGKYNENIVSIYNPVGQPLGVNLDNVTQDIAGNSPSPFVNNSCRIIVTVLPTGTTTAISGSVTAKEWIESSQPIQFAKRHYEITPATNAGTATGKVTLYFTQQEFDDFNAVNSIKLPANSGDAIGKSNLLIEKKSGTSNNGTGLPPSYGGGVATINPVDADIVWNSNNNRWEISFNVTGFSGFFVKTTTNPLPLSLLNFSGSKETGYNKLQWQTANETNTKNFELETSNDGSQFVKIATINAAGVGNNNYIYHDNNFYSDKTYYRLRMVDNDGRFTYSNIIWISNNTKEAATVYPNPAKDIININIGSNKLINTIASMYDMEGRLIRNIKLEHYQQSVNIENLNSGLYLIRFEDATTLRIVKK